MDKQFNVSFGGGISSIVYDEIRLFGEQILMCKNNSDELWTYHPLWTIHRVTEIEKKEPVFVREPGISLSERRMY